MSNPDKLDLSLRRLYDGTDAPQGFDSRWRAAVKREELLTMENTPKTKGRFVWRTVLSVAAAVVLVAGGITGMHYKPKNAVQTLASPVTYDAGEGDAASYSYDMVGNSADSGVALMKSAASSTGSAAVPSADSQRKLVRSISLTISTPAFEQAFQDILGRVDTIGGYAEDLYQYGDQQSGGRRGASLTLRVPTDQLEDFLAGIEGTGRVTERSESTTDMTVQYTDNAARLQTLKDKMQRLNELMAQAQNVSDLIELESAIQDTQYQIDSYENAQRDIDSRVDMTCVTVQLREETPADGAAADDASLGERIVSALKATVQWLGEFGRGLLVFLAMALPVIAIAAVIGLVVWLVVRSHKKKKS